MPCQFRPDPQRQRIDTGDFRSPGGGDDMGRGGVNRRPQVFADHGIDLSKLVVQLGPADAQRATGCPMVARVDVAPAWSSGHIFLKTRVAERYAI